MDIDENGGGYDTYGEEEDFVAEFWKEEASWIKLRANVTTFNPLNTELNPIFQ